MFPDVLQELFFFDKFYLFDFFHGGLIDGMQVEEDIFCCELHSLLLFKILLTQKFEGGRDNIADGFSNELSDLFHDHLEQIGFKEIGLLTHKIFLPEVEFKVELMLEYLIAGIKKIVEVHTVFELVPGVKVRNDHLEFETSWV